MPELAQDQTSNLSDVAKRIKRLERLFNISKNRAKSSQSNSGTSATSTFTEVDPRVVVYNPSGTAGDGTYQAAESVDFSVAVAEGAKLVYLQVAVAVVDIDPSSPWFGFQYTPSGWTSTIEEFHYVYPDGDISDYTTVCLPLSESLTSDIAVIKGANGGGQAWEYSFEVWGYA